LWSFNQSRYFGGRLEQTAKDRFRQFVLAVDERDPTVGAAPLEA
jgi:hypothetical protein